MSEAREQLVNLLTSRSVLKQDVYLNTKEVFAGFKRIIQEEIEQLRALIKDDRVRLDFKDKGDYEAQVFIGSDVLVFHMHTNVFRFPDDKPVWKTSYLEENRDMGYCGIINIYNFLADSFQYGRMNDPGYLIGRLFVNKENHFIVEGKGQLGFLFRDFVNSSLDDKAVRHICHQAFVHAIDFDLLMPPYEVVNQVSVMQMEALSSSLQMKTGKRLGFKFQVEDGEII